MAEDGARRRLDHLVVERRAARSRAQARDLIRRGRVSVGGMVITKPGATFTADAAVAVEAEPHVSRGVLKLRAAIEAFGFSIDGRTAIDLGASTGGFTQLLLEGGARHVYAVDVGRGQLHASLAADPRVTELSRTDARRLDRTLMPEPVDAIAADLSFISLTLALPAALALTAPGAWLVALIKPQFECGPEAIGKGGIVRDEGARREAVAKVEAFVGTQPGWRVTGVLPSPIPGGAGNAEFLLGATRA